MGTFQKLFGNKGQAEMSPSTIVPSKSVTFLTEKEIRAWAKNSFDKIMVKSLSKADRKKYVAPSTTTIERRALLSLSEITDADVNKALDIIKRVEAAGKVSDYRALLSAVDEMKQLCDTPVMIWQKVSGAAGVCGQLLTICGILFILLILMYPPYLSTVTIRGKDGRLIAQYNTPLSHNWVWDSPSGTYNYDSVQPKTSEPHVDIEHLYIYLGIGLVVTVFGAILFRQKLWGARKL